VAQTVPRNLQMTNAPVTNPIEAVDGASHYVPFGSWFASETDGENVAEATPGQGGDNQGNSGENESGSNDDSGTNPLALVGLGAIVLAIVLLAALIVILLRQQRAQ
jgi:hypothetical protein